MVISSALVAPASVLAAKLCRMRASCSSTGLVVPGVHVLGGAGWRQHFRGGPGWVRAAAPDRVGVVVDVALHRLTNG
jgi:hypothetical protein